MTKRSKKKAAAPVATLRVADAKPAPRYYLAYGSNLCFAAMRRRAPGARPVGKWLLDNARLVFRRYADVVCERGFTTPVGVWRVTPEDEKALDMYEGCGRGHYVKLEIEIDLGTAFMYVMEKPDGIAPPFESYLDTVRRGYRDFGLDEEYLDAAFHHSHDAKEHSDETRARDFRRRNYGRRVGNRFVLQSARIARRDEGRAYGDDTVN